MTNILIKRVFITYSIYFLVTPIFRISGKSVAKIKDITFNSHWLYPMHERYRVHLYVKQIGIFSAKKITSDFGGGMFH